MSFLFIKIITSAGVKDWKIEIFRSIYLKCLIKDVGNKVFIKVFSSLSQALHEIGYWSTTTKLKQNSL